MPVNLFEEVPVPSQRGSSVSPFGLKQLAQLARNGPKTDPLFHEQLSVLTQETFVSFARLQDAVSIWTADNRGMRFHTAGAPFSEVARCSAELLALARDPYSDARRMESLGRRMYRELWGPLELFLEPGRTLLIHFDAQLRGFPAGLLMMPEGGRLSERHSCLQAADFPWQARRPAEMRVPAQTKLLIVNAIPAEKEASGGRDRSDCEDLMQLAAAMPYNDMICQSSATREQFNRLAPQAEAIHCRATLSGGAHGPQLHLSTGKSGSAAELRAEAGFLSLASYRRRALERCRLVVLDIEYVSRRQGDSQDLWRSACGALHHAGAPQAVMPGWNVDTAVRRAFHLRFYEYLRTGRTVGESFRSAVDAIRGKPEWRHPHYWAGFTHSVSHL